MRIKDNRRWEGFSTSVCGSRHHVTLSQSLSESVSHRCPTGCRGVFGWTDVGRRFWGYRFWWCLSPQTNIGRWIRCYLLYHSEGLIVYLTVYIIQVGSIIRFSCSHAKSSWLNFRERLRRLFSPLFDEPSQPIMRPVEAAGLPFHAGNSPICVLAFRTDICRLYYWQRLISIALLNSPFCKFTELFRFWEWMDIMCSAHKPLSQWRPSSEIHFG